MVSASAGASLIEVSTWGHVIDTGVLATLDYAVNGLEVPLIVVLGHQGRHAMRTAVRAWNEAVMPDGPTVRGRRACDRLIVRRGVDAGSTEAVTSAHVVETGFALLERARPPLPAGSTPANARSSVPRPPDRRQDSGPRHHRRGWRGRRIPAGVRLTQR